MACWAEYDSRDDENVRRDTLMTDKESIRTIILNYNGSEITRKLCETIRG